MVVHIMTRNWVEWPSEEMKAIAIDYPLKNMVIDHVNLTHSSNVYLEISQDKDNKGWVQIRNNSPYAIKFEYYLLRWTQEKRMIGGREVSREGWGTPKKLAITSQLLGVNQIAQFGRPRMTKWMGSTGMGVKTLKRHKYELNVYLRAFGVAETLEPDLDEILEPYRKYLPIIILIIAILLLWVFSRKK